MVQTHLGATPAQFIESGAQRAREGDGARHCSATRRSAARCGGTPRGEAHRLPVGARPPRDRRVSLKLAQITAEQVATKLRPYVTRGAHDGLGNKVVSTEAMRPVTAMVSHPVSVLRRRRARAAARLSPTTPLDS